MSDTWGNDVWAMVFILALTGLTLLVRAVGGTTARVAVWHNLVWIAAVGLIGTNLVRYREASATAWLTLLVGILAFSIGSLFAMRWKTYRVGGTGVDEEPRDVEPLVTRPQLLVLLAIYAAGFAVYLNSIHERFGLSLLLDNPAAIRGAAGISYLAAVPLPARLAMYLGPFLIVVVAWKKAVNRPLPRLLNWVILAGLVVSLAALLQRTNLFMGLAWLIAVYLTRPPEVREKARSGNGKRAVGAVAVGLVCVAAFQVIGGALGKTGVQERASGNVSQTLDDTGLTSIFVYFTSGTAAFLALTDSDNHERPPPPSPGRSSYGDYNPQTWGAATFDLPLRVFPVVEPLPTASFINVGVPTNVYTGFEPLYRDWRMPGVAVGSALFGLMVTLLYRRRFESARLFWLQSLLVSTVLFMPFAARMISTQFVVQVAVVLWLTRRKRPGPPKESRPQVVRARSVVR